MKAAKTNKNYITTEEKTNFSFFLRIKDNRIMKWYIYNNVWKKKKSNEKQQKGLMKYVKVMYTNIDGIIARKLELSDLWGGSGQCSGMGA